MDYCQEINDYLKYYEECPNCFNMERKLLMENIVYPTLKRTDVFFDKKRYYECLEFCKIWFYEFFPYEKFVTAFMFMYDSKGFLLFKKFVIIEGRGNGKDGWIMPIATYFTSELYGIPKYHVVILATSEKQAGRTFKVAHSMFEQNKKKMRKYFSWNLEMFTNLRTRSECRVLTSSTKTADGDAPGLIVFNEYHAYINTDNVNVVKGGLGKVEDPREIIITSDGLIREGALDELKTACLEVLNGEENTLKLFPFWCKLDDISQVDNPDSWILANPSIEYLPVLRQQIIYDYNEQKKMPSLRAEFLAKRMNLPQMKEVESVTSWENILKACYKDIEKKIPRVMPTNIKGKKALLGLDYASLNDFAAAGFLIKENSEYIWRGHTWICKRSKYFNEIKFPFNLAGTPGYEDFTVIDADCISEDLIMEWVMNTISELNVERILLDNYKFQLMKNAFERNGLTIRNKDNPDGIVEIIRYPASIAAIVGPILEVWFATGIINLGDSAMMRWAIRNTYMKDKKDGNKYFEKVEQKRRKNDIFMAFVCTVSKKDLLEEEVTYIYV